jgi:bleomycin hydrolase
MKALTVAQMKDGEVVWFGSDCGKFGSRSDGIWDPDSFVYDELLGMDLMLTKEQALDGCDSAMNHAMVLTGVNLDENGKPNRWKIENSWGPEAGQEGYFIASDKWFDLQTYQVIINKKYLNDVQRAALDETPVALNPWDPMGSLAD